MTFAATLRILPAQIWLLLLLLGASFANAGDPRPYLWVIENGSRSSYLFGTIHSGHPELNRLHASVQQAFEHSDRYYGELELDAATIATTAKLLQLPAGQQLSRILSKQRQQRINRLLAQTAPRLTIQPFERLKPWALAITLSLLEDQLRFGANPAMDQQLYQRAKTTGKTTGALETPQQQTRVFDSLSWNEQMMMLDAILEAMEQSMTQGESWMDETYKAYRSGDPDQLNALLDQQLPVSDKLQQKIERLLITERNRYMSEQIDRQLKQHLHQQLFFAVGAAHFGSEKGIQQLLRQRGYSISRATQ
ncbi:MAG: TraB/GumN family protein [Halopseudomonas sp.]